MKHFFEKNKIFIAIVVGAFIIGSFIYFSVPKSSFSELSLERQIDAFNKMSVEEMIINYPLIKTKFYPIMLREIEAGKIKPSPLNSVFWLGVTNKLTPNDILEALQKGVTKEELLKLADFLKSMNTLTPQLIPLFNSIEELSPEQITQVITFSHLPIETQIQKFNDFPTDKMIEYYPLLKSGAMQEFVREADNGIIKPSPRMSTLYLMLTHQFNEDWGRKALQKGISIEELKKMAAFADSL